VKGTVYVVCCSPPRRRALAGALRAGRDPPEVRELSTLRFPPETGHDALLVVDLRDPLDPRERQWTGQAAIAGVILIATSAQSVPAPWLEVARQPNVQLLLTPSPDSIDEAHFRGAVTRALERNIEHMVAAVRKCCGQEFDALQDVIRAVLTDPWGIRRPRDLARALGISPAQLRTRCGPVAGGRIDHVLAFIRLCACTFLAGECHIPVAAALEAVGVRDRSNFRRQVRRARAARGHASSR
jgi:hypothetical protein